MYTDFLIFTNFLIRWITTTRTKKCFLISEMQGSNIKIKGTFQKQEKLISFSVKFPIFIFITLFKGGKVDAV